MSESKYAEDLALAHLLADIADAISLDRYQSLDLVITTKPDNTPVTDADRAVETAIREHLQLTAPMMDYSEKSLAVISQVPSVTGS
jgi:histidinol-phosphatase